MAHGAADTPSPPWPKRIVMSHRATPSQSSLALQLDEFFDEPLEEFRRQEAVVDPGVISVKSAQSCGQVTGRLRNAKSTEGPGESVKDWYAEIEIVDIAVPLASCLLLFKLLTKTNRWKQRLGAITSPLLEQPGYRALLLVVVVGALLICTLPEAAFVLPALDAIGLDVVTIFVALEMRHYLAFVVRRLRIPTHPMLWAYNCMWVMVWIKMLNGTLAVSRPARVQHA